MQIDKGGKLKKVRGNYCESPTSFDIRRSKERGGRREVKIANKERRDEFAAGSGFRQWRPGAKKGWRVRERCWVEWSSDRMGRGSCLRQELLATMVEDKTVAVGFSTIAEFSVNPLSVHQIDINNLHGHLDEEIFMTAPEGYDIAPGHACLLRRLLYGSKQASRQWNVEFTRSLEGLGFKQSGHDHCLFFKPLDTGFIGLLVYVDDVLIMAPSLASISQDLGCARYFLGLQIGRSKEGMSITQSKYILDLVSECGLQDGKSAATPLPPGIKFNSNSGNLFEDPEWYRRLVGCLLYLSFTRPDISHGVQQLSWFLQRPCHSHWQAALHLVCYLKGCSEVGLFFPSSNSLQLQAFCDADCGACADTRWPLTGYAIFLGPALISWKTKKQCIVSRSSTEVEYRSMATTACELQWISYLLRDFGVTVSTPIPFHCDNQAALHIMANPVFHERTKHLDIDCHVVRDLYKFGFLLPVIVRSKEQVADLFTKPLSSLAFLPLLCKLGLFAFAPRRLELDNVACSMCSEKIQSSTLKTKAL
ncbi:UNVERIFIED_CONTAM: Retrovirus-related Pol polyprotein from transposon RE2 [Sesamum indicum]